MLCVDSLKVAMSTRDTATKKMNLVWRGIDE
jgi:hypothetical protein